jgi:hypothetical protein
MKFRKIFSRIEIQEGALIPKGYGFAYMKYAEAKAVFYRIPLNLMINLHRKISERVMAPSPPRLNRMLDNAYMKGRMDGYRANENHLLDTYEKWRQEKLHLGPKRRV